MNSNEFSQRLNLCIEEIIYEIDLQSGKLDNKKLIKICSRLGNIFDDEIDPHYYHEVAETSFNWLIKNKYNKDLLESSSPIKLVNEFLHPLTQKFPTQSWRSRKQNSWQQFSTPPHIAYLLTYILDLKAEEKVLEPSAGTGNLAVWFTGAEANIFTNELDHRRRVLLENLGFKPTAFNGEFINDYLSTDISPNCILMNPPFSANGERTKKNSSKFGFRHVESALERLRKGGKFGIILGEAGGLDTKTGNDFWRKLSDKIQVKSIIKLDGREYYKNGTTIDINLITGRKHLEPKKTDWNQALNKIINLSVKNVEEAFEKVSQLNLRLDN